ncbi:host specificity protein [Bradyrhizobium sp. ORS 86]|uniref:host specificity protein n=1 Tax=unclassified Bradyrhizobium TaxID=2631580 RepID=UPI00388E63F2
MPTGKLNLMYGRIVGSSSQSAGASQADEAGPSSDSGRFADTLAGMHPGSSSSAATYSLDPRAPIVEIKRSSWKREVKAFHGNDIKSIAENPQEYSDFVSKKAVRTATVAKLYGGTDEDGDETRYFSYQLGDKSVGLLRTEGGFRIKADQFREQFPGRKGITSVVDLRITHPLVENAGDILLEHQLRLDGERALVMSRPALAGMEPRLAEMGFVHLGDLGEPLGNNCWVLDPNHSDKWTKNSEGKWQRAGKPEMYLSKMESGDVDTEASSEAELSETDSEASSSDDDLSWYFLQRMNLA